ncbi:MAG: cob(I)yrinic acid a,c-diamide adenosyltransferase [Armatimonadetes bacterium]|nr:cob(I)yrinic acid a,c-diamide adenosyltransferase [Armatimonadota bacterium]
MRVYTGTGDSGTTGLFGNARVSKTSARIEAIGEIDELNAALGLAQVSSGDPTGDTIFKIQNWLFDLGAELSCPNGEMTSVREPHAKFLEADMDRMTEQLPELRTFVLPGGCELAARLHLARTICRRAERTLLKLHKESPIGIELLVFLNRLSDWCFVAARFANQNSGGDVTWKKFTLDS